MTGIKSEQNSAERTLTFTDELNHGQIMTVSAYCFIFIQTQQTKSLF